MAPATALRQGLLSNLGNPKMAVFFTSLLPQFGASFPALLALGLVFCSLTLVWLTGYAAAVAKAGDFLCACRGSAALSTVSPAPFSSVSACGSRANARLGTCRARSIASTAIRSSSDPRLCTRSSG